MTLNIWEQTEWHGMARKGPSKKDPFTSQLEVNTQPGRYELKKLVSRKPYLSTHLATTATRINHPYGGWHLLDKGIGDGPLQEDLPLKTDKLVAYVCFKVDDLLLLDTSKDYEFFNAGSGQGTTGWAWGYYLEHDGTDWHLKFQARDDAAAYKTCATVTAMVSGSWYWAECYHSGAGSPYDLVLKVYKDGSESLLETAVTTSGCNRNTYTGSTFFPRLGYKCPGFSIAYASIGTDGAACSPWEPKFAEGGGVYKAVFYPLLPNTHVLPALHNDSTNHFCWHFQPNNWMHEIASTSGNFNTKGLQANYYGYDLDISGIDLFQKRTVFMFYISANLSDPCTLFATDDSMFRIQFESNKVYVWWPPLTQSSGSEVYAHLAQHISAASFTDNGEWIAVEVNPTTAAATDNIIIYRYAAGSWGEVSSGGSGTQQGGGVLDIDAQKALLFMPTRDLATTFIGRLHDFRIIVGDDSWATNFVAASITTHPPSELALWINNDTTSRFPNLDKVKEISFPRYTDIYEPVCAWADRVSGEYRLKASQLQGALSVDGCDDMDKGPFPRLTHIWPKSDGNIRGTSDGYYVDNLVITSQVRQLVKHAARISTMGALKYLTGPAPLQVLHDRFVPVGLSQVVVEAQTFGTAAGSATNEFLGGLTESSDYKYKITLYDPQTGNETNPHGPFRLTTGSAASACSFDVVAKFFTPRDLSSYEARYYRFHEGDGLYYLDGSSGISELAEDTTWNAFYWQSNFRFTLDDDDISLHKEIETDNDPPPLHVVTHITNGRAFFVDAIYPSRVWFSKLFQTASVPGANLIWTDEGSGGDILGFLDGFGGTLLLREQSIWIIPSFYDETQAFAQVLVPDIGCVSGNCAVFANGRLWWASPGGVYSWDGQAEPVNHSDLLDGIDRKVWDHAPIETIAYYDKSNFRVVFTCDGSGICFDVQSGAASLISAPERCHTEVSTSTYSGPVYGTEGNVWRETDGNKSLTIDSGDGMGMVNVGLTTAANITAESWFYTIDFNGLSSGSSVCAFRIGSNLVGTAYHSTASCLNRSITLIKSDYSDLWTGLYTDGWSTRTCFIRTEQPLFDNFIIDRFPFYYKSNDVFLGRMSENRNYERMEVLTGDDESTASATASFTFESNIPGQASALVVSANNVLLNNRDVHQLPLRRRGNQFFYTVLCTDYVDQPEIDSLGVHFRVSLPRGRRE